MLKVYVVIRTIGEKTTDDCIRAVEERFGKDYEVIRDFKPLENAAKRTIQIAAEKANEYGWVLAVDADIILEKSRDWITDYCRRMRAEYSDRLFCFNAWLYCTKRGLIGGMHLYRTKYCQEVYNKVKDLSFQYHPGREESEIFWYVRDKMGIGVLEGKWQEPFGTHLWKN